MSFFFPLNVVGNMKVGDGRKTKTKDKPNTRAERAVAETNDHSGEWDLLHYAKQSTPSQERAPTNLSSKISGNEPSRKRERSRFESCLRIAVPVIILLLCLVAVVVVSRIVVFSQRDRNSMGDGDLGPKTPARMVVYEVTERKLTPLEINNEDNIFEEGDTLAKARAENAVLAGEAEEMELPGKL